MGKPYSIDITDGSGSSPILNGNYSVTANVTGYDNSSITPSSLSVIEGTNQYVLKISANGTLTLHITDTGDESGNPIAGAKFFRTDKNGNQFGNELTSNETGNITISNVPYDVSNTIKVYFKQTASDGEHEFDQTVQSTTLDSQTKTFEIKNTPATSRTILLQDNNFEGLPIESGNIILN